MADFDPSESQNHWTDFDEMGMVNYVWDPTPHDNIGEASTAWVVWANNVTCQIFEFLSFLFCLLQHLPRSHFLTDRDNLYAKMRVSSQGCAFWDLHNIRLHLEGQTPKNLPKMGGNRHFAAKSEK